MSVRTDTPLAATTDPDVRPFRVQVPQEDLFVSEVRDGFRSLRP
jgi:hypothetical protein